MFTKRQAAPSNKRHESRKSFPYYMQLTNAENQEIIGYLSDISTGGFKLDANHPLPLNKDFEFHLALSADVAHKPYMIFKARSKWCQTDPIDPFVYNVGFHLTAMQPEDREIFVRVMNTYGAEKSNFDSTTTPTRSRRWQ